MPQVEQEIRDEVAACAVAGEQDGGGIAVRGLDEVFERGEALLDEGGVEGLWCECVCEVQDGEVDAVLAEVLLNGELVLHMAGCTWRDVAAA